MIVCRIFQNVDLEKVVLKRSECIKNMSLDIIVLWTSQPILGPSKRCEYASHEVLHLGCAKAG